MDSLASRDELQAPRSARGPIAHFGPVFPCWHRFWTIRTYDNGTLVRAVPSLPVASLQAALRGAEQPANGPIWANVIDVADASGAVVDRCAWAIGKPAEWWLEHGGAPILGAVEIERAASLDRVLHVYGTPQAWRDAHAPGAGYWPAIAVLDWSRDVTFWLSGIRELVADTLEVADALSAICRRARLPRFRVIEGGQP